MNSKEYWEKREAEAFKRQIKDEAEYEKELQRIYKETLDRVQKEIEAFYGRYAAAEGISIADAKKRVAKVDIEAYERKAKKYVADREFSKEANEEMRLYNATMRINRLEMLKANIGLEMIAGHEELQEFMEEVLQGRTMEELQRQAGILGKTIQTNAKLANSIVNASFHNATFSNRIWMYQDLLKNELDTLLQSGMIQGKNPRVLAKEIRKRFDVKASDAERLMRTELARVQTDAQKKAFEEMGFEMYRFIHNKATHKGKRITCSDCVRVAEKDNGYGKGIYLVKDMQIGVNAPPLHPNCRCSVAAHEDDAEFEAWLDYLDKGGTTEQWNKTGKKQWKNGASIHDIIKGNANAHSVSDARSLSELEEMMRSITGKKISLAGTEFELMKKNMQQILDLAEEYGVRFNEITVTNKRKYLGEVLRTGRYADYVAFNYPTAYYKKTAKLLEMVRKSAEAGSMPNIGEKHYDILTTTHEFAHTLSDELSSRLYGYDVDFWNEIEDVYAAYKKNGNGVLGKYASSNQNEFMAEAFAEAKLSESPSKWAQMTLEIIDKYFKKKK